MKKLNIFSALLFICLVLAGFLYTSCSKEDDGDSSIRLESWGPSPALRGGEMKFIGNNLDKVTEVILPNSISVTTFKIKTPELIVIDVPEATMPGQVVLKTPQGDITPMTLLDISEPIVLDTIQPVSARPGETVTIRGDYLNLIASVTFSNKKVIDSSDFISQSKTEIQVVVPNDAQTGSVLIANGATEPIQVESTFKFDVKLPVITSMSPLLIKAGTNLTITGTNLDLITQVIFGGRRFVTSFVSQTATQIVMAVPNNTLDGTIKLVVASGIEIESTDALTMIVPSITSITPNPAKNKALVTIDGTDLDLVSSVVFGGDKNGTIQAGGTASQITVQVPADAVVGKIKLNTLSTKSVTSTSDLDLIVPTITSITTTPTAAYQDITINGTDLDIITKVYFTSPPGAEYSASVSGATASQIIVPVTAGSISGKIKLLTTNGTLIESTQSLDIVPDVPIVSSWPSEAYLTTKLTITGTKLDLATDIIFPGEVKATMFGTKSSTLVEVYIPSTTAKGIGKIKFVTVNKEIVYSSDINFKALGAEEVVDPTLVFFDFDGLNSWWQDIGGVEENATLSVDGSKYYRVNTSGATGWKAMFFRNSGNNFPGAVIGTNINDYSLKFDINILDPISDPNGVIAIRLKGSEGDFFYRWSPWKTTPYQTTGWITVTVPLSSFVDNYGWGTVHMTDVSKVDSDFGMVWNDSSIGPALNFCIDNVRFQHN